MAKGDRVAKLLDELGTMKRGTSSEAGARRLRELLHGREAMVVARAVEVVEAWGERELGGELVGVFGRFLEEGLEDPGCRVKENVARLLCEWGVEGSERVFERGIRHKQMEAVWRDRVDVAGGLRGWCAAGLSAMGHWDQVRLILPLLLDEQAQARVMGIRALVQGGSPEAEVALRLKVMVGDVPGAEPEEAEEVIGECLYGLAEGWGARVVGFLEEQAGGPWRRLALFALARCRADEAWGALVRMYEGQVLGAKRKELLEAMATARSEKGVAWMCDLIREGRESEAVEAVRAMAIRREEGRVWERVVEAAKGNGSERVKAEVISAG